MKKLFLITILVMGILLTGCLERSKVVQIKGSDTILNVTQRLSEKYMGKNPEAKIAVTGGGSGVGVSSLLNKTTNIAMTSRPMKSKEYDKAKELGLEIEEVVLGFDGITIIVNKENPIKNLDSVTLGKIFRGEITNWKEIGGEDSKIVPLSRDSSSGTHEFFKEHVVRGGEKNNLEYGNETLYMPSNEAIKQEVKSNKYAIGYIGMGYMDDSVLALSIDGVLPTKENVSNKSYPIAREIYWYVPANREGTLKGLVEFAISQEGQKIVESEGFIKR